MTIGYCVKCRKKKTMKSAKTVEKKGRTMVVGVCEKCGTKMSRFVKS